MRVVVQRAARAEVRVDGEVVGRLPAPGLLALVGVTHSDTPAVAEKLARKLWELRVLDSGRLSAAEHERAGWSKGDVSASDSGAPILVVSQFTLYADTRKGRRPSWSRAAPGAVAEPLVDHFVAALRALGAHVETGRFGALMDVELVNDGPVTVLLEA
ncbi:MAG: D-tyrosyl-tRNA(Tyr) deacylase [Propionibacteriaceae bacterium]|jgi:D-tyrosyl-tRNA(Tyr) deacylase|nr:D-tyrosyl-tRNA(Tyr) deacylase [Propionibacteriaceae bacterium]